MQDDNKLDVEHQLNGVRLPAAPKSLRHQVLTALQAEANPHGNSDPVAVRLNVGLAKRSSWERVCSLATAVCFLAVTGWWLVVPNWQAQRRKALLGPTPSELKAAKIVDAFDLADSETSKRELTESLARQISQVDRRHQVIPLPPLSIISVGREPSLLTRPSTGKLDAKENRPRRSDADDNHSDGRGISLLPQSSTA